MKYYKVKDIVEVLTEYQAIGIEGYCGFSFDEQGKLVIALKDHPGGWTDTDGCGEAIDEITMEDPEGEDE